MSDDESRPVKRAKKPPKHEYTVILLDVGVNMAMPVKGCTGSALDLAKEVLDWIFTRKIFTESPDEFTLILFGSDETRNTYSNNAENIYFCEEEMQTAKVDWLKLVENEIKLSAKAEGDFLTALIVAVDYMRTCLEGVPEGVITGRNILLLSNLAGCHLGEHAGDVRDADAIVNGIGALDINFNVIGPSSQHYGDGEDGKADEEMEDSEESSKNVKAEIGAKILSDIAERTEGVVYTFTEALPMLQHFVPRKVNARGQKFLLELGEDLKLPLQMYKKIQLADMKLKFRKVDENTNVEIKRETIYERPPEDDVNRSTVGSIADSAKQADNAVAEKQREYLGKEDVIRGYMFGSTIVPFNEEDRKEYGWPRETRSMRLIHFAKRSEVLQHYLMDGSAYYCIPPADDKDGCVAISALVRALLSENSVAITRYAYNAASHPRILALFPRISKKGVDMFVAIQLPFYEDFRGLEFPPIDSEQFEPRAEQNRAMEAFVDSMDLSKSYFDPETGEYGEDLRPRNVPNPKLQRQCEAMKYRALHPGEPIPEIKSRIISEFLEPKAELREKSKEPLEWIEKKFPLHVMKKARKSKVKDEKDDGDDDNGDDDDDDDSIPRFGVDNSTLPESGRFISADEVESVPPEKK